MSKCIENTTDASEAHGGKETDKSINGASHELAGEKIRANLEPLKPQFSALTQLKNA